jgi:hypothetical protein
MVKSTEIIDIPYRYGEKSRDSSKDIITPQG